MNKTKLYVDCQFFQTPVWDRGMGRYAMSLLKSLHKVTPDVGYTLIFSENLPLSDQVKQAMERCCPGAEVAQLDLQAAVKTDYRTAASVNKELLNKFIEQRKEPGTREIFMIPCLFQEPTASVYPEGVEKWLVYYDAIPMLYYKRYLYAINYENFLQRHGTLFEADTIFTISKTVANDLALYYGLQTDAKRTIINIDGACIDGMFANKQKPKAEIPKHFILFPTSNDVRKNNELAIKAFNQFCSITDKKYKLVVTSTYDKGTKAVLDKLSDKTIFTGNLTDAELTWLYEHADAVLFTSEYEGLGLPVLEAVATDNKVVCSDIPVFREISKDAFYYCDPFNIGDIAHALKRAVNSEGWESKRKKYAGINKRYTWEKTAGIVHGHLTAPRHDAPEQAKKPRIAILAPTPCGYSAVGKVVQELHAAMGQYFDIDYYLEDRKKDIPVSVRPNFLEHVAPVFGAAFFNAEAYRNYDAVIYHIGNSEYHFNAIISALHLPGVAIFHDTVLRDAYDEMTYLGYTYPSRHSAELKLDKLTGTKQTACLTSLVNNQMGGVAHSHYAKDAINSVVMTSGIEIAAAGLPVTTPEHIAKSRERDVVNIGLAGILSERKGLDVIKSIVLDPTFGDRVVVHVFGFSMVYPEVIEELQLMKNVKLETNLTDLEYQTRLSELDILINYRASYRGETSLTALEAMRFGCAVIVNGSLGWFAELPDDAVVKVGEQDQVSTAVHKLVDNIELRKKISDNARQYAMQHHDPGAYARALLDSINSINPISQNVRRAEALKAAQTAEQAVDAIKNINAQEKA